MKEFPPPMRATQVAHTMIHPGQWKKWAAPSRENATNLKE